MAESPPLRRSAASRLRGLAERLEPRRQVLAGPPTGPLVRVGGSWWPRDAIAGREAENPLPRPQTASLGGASPTVYIVLFAFVWLQRAGLAVKARARGR